MLLDWLQYLGGLGAGGGGTGLGTGIGSALAWAKDPEALTFPVELETAGAAWAGVAWIVVEDIAESALACAFPERGSAAAATTNNKPPIAMSLNIFFL